MMTDIVVCSNFTMFVNLNFWEVYLRAVFSILTSVFAVMFSLRACISVKHSHIESYIVQCFLFLRDRYVIFRKSVYLRVKKNQRLKP